MTTGYRIVSHHVWRRTARRRAGEMNEARAMAGVEPVRHFYVAKMRRGRYRWAVVYDV